MELRTLHYFTTVAEELNITRAAERLNMSQPPLSKQIINLEEELGVRLFTRGKRHLSLTDAGIVFYRRAKQILDLCDMSKEEISSLEGLSGTIHISLVEGRARVPLRYGTPPRFCCRERAMGGNYVERSPSRQN